MVKTGPLIFDNMNKNLHIIISLVFLYSCSNEPKLTHEMMGIFIGHEPPSFMRVGNKQIEVP